MKLFSVIVISLFASVTFASKARVAALQGADHLVDVQTAFKNPAYINKLSPILTFEFGAAGTSAEGGILMQTASANKLLVYAGHQNTNAITASGDLRTSRGYLGQNNPVEVLYGVGDMAFGGSISSVDNKKSGTKETTVIGKWGTITNDLYVYAHVSLVSTAEITAGNKKINTAPGILVGAAKENINYRYFGSIVYGNSKDDAANVSTTIKDLDIKLGIEDRSMKKADADIYFGTRLEVSERDVEGKKISKSQLPIFIGIETPVAS